MRIMGDVNARIQECRGEEEEAIVGKHTLEEGEQLQDLDSGQEDNKEHLIQLCKCKKLKIKQTFMDNQGKTVHVQKTNK